MAVLDGTDIVLSVRTTIGTPDVFSVLGRQLDGSRSLTRDAYETSSKDDDDKTYGAGKRDSTFSVECRYEPGDAAMAALLTAYESASGEIRVKIPARGADVAKMADGIVTDISEEYPDGDAASRTVEVQISGGWMNVV